MAWLESLSLSGERCQLEPLQHAHHDDLVAAVKDGKLWQLWYTLVPTPDQVEDEITRRLQLQQQADMLPLVVIDKATGKVIGMTSYLNIDAQNRRVEIGGTWLAKSAQRTGINTEAKFLLLQYAFEQLHCHAVEFRTHFLNQQSRLGIERLGAKLDAVLRNHMVMPNGTLRDTCVYSIISNEWPTVKNHLQWRQSATINNVSAT